jgi:hypothetical protein
MNEVSNRHGAPVSGATRAPFVKSRNFIQLFLYNTGLQLCFGLDLH